MKMQIFFYIKSIKNVIQRVFYTATIKTLTSITVWSNKHEKKNLKLCIINKKLSKETESSCSWYEFTTEKVHGLSSSETVMHMPASRVWKDKVFFVINTT